jgi:hypothetical protein
MAIQANALPPSLVADLNDMKRRLTAIERKPEPLSKFDRYPCAEWQAIDRPLVGGNVWSSVSIADATGLTFDRMECKFITDFLYTGKREAEIRLAAFRHYGSLQKQCVSASSVLNLSGNATRSIGTVLLRWIHGIPFGWDYANDTNIYTIELQHRYKVGPEPYVSNLVQVGALWKNEKDADPGLLFADADGSAHWTVATNDQTPQAGWVNIPPFQLQDNVLNGSYAISAMEYCVGLPADRIPDATTAGFAIVNGSSSSWGRAGDVTEAYF